MYNKNIFEIMTNLLNYFAPSERSRQRKRLLFTHGGNKYQPYMLPDVFVFGGGLSKTERMYREVPRLLPKYVFGGEADTPLVQAKFGDSSGVRGAAWLWPGR